MTIFHARKSNRLEGYDYSLAGAYFVTLVVQNRLKLFGYVANNEICLKPAGCMVKKWWLELQQKFPTLSLGAYVIMPNHFHGIIILNDTTLGVDQCVDPGTGEHIGSPLQPSNPPCLVDHGTGEHAGSPLPITDPPSLVGFDLRVDHGTGDHAGSPLPNPKLSQIIQWFKTMTTNEYIRGVKNHGWIPFEGEIMATKLLPSHHPQ